MKTSAITGYDGAEVFVSVSDSRESEQTSEIGDLPEGAEPTGVIERARAKIQDVEHVIRQAVIAGTAALKEHSPSEWKLDIKVGFSGGVTPVPVLVSIDAEAVFRITATWRK